MSSLRLPFVSLDTRAAPKVVDRATWGAACEELLVREKANLRESDALAAARRRLPMTPVPRDVQVVGADGPVPLVNAFEGRRQLVGYFHMWHDGNGRGTSSARAARSSPPRSSGRSTCTVATSPWPSSAKGPTRRAGRTPTSCRTGCPGGRPGEPTDWSPDGTSGFSAASCATATMSTRRGGPPVAALRRWPGATTCWTVRSTAGRRAGRTRPRVGRSRSASEASQFRTAGRPTIQWSVTDEPVVDGVPHCH